MQAVFHIPGCARYAWKTYHIRLYVQYSLPEDDHKMFETCRRQEDINKKINSRSTLCWLTLHNCVTMHGTETHKSLLNC